MENVFKMWVNKRLVVVNVLNLADVGLDYNGLDDGNDEAVRITYSNKKSFYYPNTRQESGHTLYDRLIDFIDTLDLHSKKMPAEPKYVLAPR